MANTKSKHRQEGRHLQWQKTTTQKQKRTVQGDSIHSTSLSRSRRRPRQNHRTRQLSWILGDPAHIIIIIIIMTKVNKAPQTCQRPGRLCTRGSPEDEKVMYNPKSKRLTALTSLRDFQGTFRGCPHRAAVAGGTATEV